MLGPVDYILWLLTFLLEVVGLVCVLKARALTRYPTLTLYLFCSLAGEVARYFILASGGYTSTAYYYFYFYSDSLLTICLYFALMGLYSHVFSEMGVSKYLRGGAMLLLGGTAWLSYHMVSSSSDRFLTLFAVELSRNLYFVGLLLTYLLWGTMIKMHENRTRLLQLVLALGIYFSAFSASYALTNMYPNFGLWRYVAHFMAMWLPLSWAYTFVKIPEDARLTTARVLAPNR